MRIEGPEAVGKSVEKCGSTVSWSEVRPVGQVIVAVGIESS